MKNLFSTLSIIFCTIIFTSCDPGYTLEYVVDNQASDNVTIVNSISAGFNPSSDSSSINSDSQLLIHVESGIGEAESYFENQTDLPFDTISITNVDGQPVTRDVSSIDHWEREYIQTDALVIFKLTITDNDF